MLGTPVDRAREHTSHRNPIRSLYWRSKARSPHWASVAAVPPGHVVRPRCSPMRIVAREESGCSRRIGSVQKDSAARPSPRGARIVSPLRCVPAALPSQGPRERRTGRKPEARSNQRKGQEQDEAKQDACSHRPRPFFRFPFPTRCRGVGEAEREVRAKALRNRRVVSPA